METGIDRDDFDIDLNACAEMRKKLTATQQRDYGFHIQMITGKHHLDFANMFYLIDATAAQHCEAFLRTIWKWKE